MREFAAELSIRHSKRYSSKMTVLNGMHRHFERARRPKTKWQNDGAQRRYNVLITSSKWRCRMSKRAVHNAPSFWTSQWRRASHLCALSFLSCAFQFFSMSKSRAHRFRHREGAHFEFTYFMDEFIEIFYGWIYRNWWNSNFRKLGIMSKFNEPGWTRGWTRYWSMRGILVLEPVRFGPQT